MFPVVQTPAVQRRMTHTLAGIGQSVATVQPPPELEELADEVLVAELVPVLVASPPAPPEPPAPVLVVAPPAPPALLVLLVLLTVVLAPVVLLFVVPVLVLPAPPDPPEPPMVVRSTEVKISHAAPVVAIRARMPGTKR